MTGMDEDDIKHIRDSTIITEFNLNEEGEVKDFLTKVPNVVVIQIVFAWKCGIHYVHVYSQKRIHKIHMWFLLFPLAMVTGLQTVL